MENERRPQRLLSLEVILRETLIHKVIVARFGCSRTVVVWQPRRREDVWITFAHKPRRLNQTNRVGSGMLGLAKLV